MGKTLNLCIANAKGCPNLYYSLQLALLFIYQTAEPMEVSTTTTATRPMETTVVTTSQGPVPVAAQPEAPTAVPQREEAEEPAVAQETQPDTTGTDISDLADVVMLEADEEDVTFLQEVSSELADPVSTRVPSSRFQLGVSIDLDALRQGPSWRWSRYLPELQPQYPPREDGGQGIQKSYCPCPHEGQIPSTRHPSSHQAHGSGTQPGQGHSLIPAYYCQYHSHHHH